MSVSVWRCLFCNNEQPTTADFDREPIRALFARDTFNKSGDTLKTQLSIFFMLRNVLGLPPDFLGDLLHEHGSPSGWKIQLCRPCNRMFSDAEHLWEKIKGLEKEFEKVTFEIKDLLVNSISPEEGEALVKHSDDLEAHKAVIKEQLLGHRIPVPDTVRATFFLCLHEQSSENDRNVMLKTGRKPPAKLNKTKLNWHESGVPFLALADFEKKIKEFGEMMASMSKSTPPPLDYATTSSSKTECKKIQNHEDDDNDEVITILDDTSQSSCGKFSSRQGPPTPAISNKDEEEEEEEPSIRIVQTSSLMERDEEDDEEEDLVPQVIGIIKRDIHDAEMVEEDTEDPLNDPDYSPDGDHGEMSIRIAATATAPAPSGNGAEKKPEDYPSKLKRRSIVPVKKGEKLFQCTRCRAEFETRSGCQTHILKDHYGENQRFHCHICSAKFDLHHQIYNHVAKCHGHVRTPYDDGFNPETDYISFKRHKKASSAQEGKEDGPTERKKFKDNFGPVYECPVPGCPVTFDYKSKLNKHARDVHELNLQGLKLNLNEKIPIDKLESYKDPHGHTCELCSEKGIIFKALSRDILDIHSKQRHGISRRNSDANVRNSPVSKKPKEKKVVAKKKLTTRVPTPVKRPSTMKCPDCQLVLPTASAIVEHLKHPENKCPDCTKHFLFDMDLKRHLELDHAGRRAFQCPYCPKSFSAQTIYEKHIDNHQTFDIHECEICHEKLTGFTTLTNHMEAEHGFIHEQVRQDPEIFGI